VIFHEQDSDLFHAQSLGSIDTASGRSGARTWFAVTQAGRLSASLAINSSAKIIAESKPASGKDTGRGHAPPAIEGDFSTPDDSQVMHLPEINPSLRQDGAI